MARPTSERRAARVIKGHRVATSKDKSKVLIIKTKGARAIADTGATNHLFKDRMSYNLGHIATP
eukprot:COSAG01_NODE_3256_length_6345_cov_15.186359_11_plen_64_part_00